MSMDLGDPDPFRAPIGALEPPRRALQIHANLGTFFRDNGGDPRVSMRAPHGST